MEPIKIETLWREEKYRVMYYSQRHYNEIRIAMREKRYEEAHRLIGEARQTEPTEGSKSNACQHIWGYFKKYATAAEKEKYMKLLQQKDFAQLLIYFLELAKSYQVPYLLNSRILTQKEWL